MAEESAAARATRDWLYLATAEAEAGVALGSSRFARDIGHMPIERRNRTYVDPDGESFFEDLEPLP